LLPLVFGQQPIGLLSVRIAGNRQLDEEDLEFARSLAQQATLAVELARLAEQAKQTALAIEREKAVPERAVELPKANEALRGFLDADLPNKSSLTALLFPNGRSRTRNRSQ
jgi:GAF domain-containing protein